MKNPVLFLFDLVTLPITVLRLIIIYFFGSRYNIKGFEFLDVMTHAENKYFNQQEDTVTVDTSKENIKVSINRASMLELELDVPTPLTPNKNEDISDSNKIRQVEVVPKFQPIEIKQETLSKKEKLENNILNVERIIEEELRGINDVFSESISDTNT